MCRCGGTRLEALADLYGKKITDNDDVMILREIRSPEFISEALGKWVTLNDREDEGLVEDIDIGKNMLVVLFGDVNEGEEYEVSFESSDIVMWYKMSSKEQQEKEENAARVVQKAIRYKLSKKMYFNRPVSKKQQSTSSSLYNKLSPSDNILQQCMKPKLKNTKGFYVQSPVVPNRKGLVDMYDLEHGLIRVVYDADEFVLEKIYNFSDDLVWYSNANSSEKQDSSKDLEKTESEETAADLKSNYRGRCVCVYV